MTLDSSTEDMAERHGDDVAAFLRELIKTDLVVRVEDAGDYVLEYTDRNGAIQRQTLSGLTPGEPRTVSGADPVAPAVLKRGDEVVVSRAGIQGEWWHVGDIPLGFNMSEGASAAYDFRSRVEETVTLEDLNVEEQGMLVESANFQLKLPIEGELSYELGTDTADGAPLTLAGSVEIPPSAGDLATLEVTATMQGEPGTAGIIAGVDEARASGSVRIWWEDGQPVAAQFLGGEYDADPRATAWADGFFADMAEGQNCAGKTKADRCEPEELEAVSGSEPAGEKETFSPEDYPRVDDPDMSAESREEAQKMVDTLRQFFALDIVRGDKLTITAQATEEDIARGDPSAPRMSFRFDFVLEAVEEESVAVPAGTFDALKITESMRSQMSVADVEDPSTGDVVVDDFSMDEIVARNTYWLELETYRPVKMEASTPMDVDALLKRMVDAVEPSAWDQIGGKPIDDNDWRVTLNAESSYEATTLRGQTHYSSLVGLTLAHFIASSSSAPMTWAMQSAGMGMGPMFGGGTDYATPAYPVEGNMTYPYPGDVNPDAEPVSISLTSAGPVADNVKTYTIASARGDWSSVGVMVDGEYYGPAWSEDGSCVDPMEYEYALCRDGEALEGWETIAAGDVFSVYATGGETLRLVDYSSGSTVLTLTVG